MAIFEMEFGDGCKWWDLVGPTKEELENVSYQFKIPHDLVLSGLDPEHLPKYEEYNDVYFIVLRSYDETAPKDGDTVQELTRKLVLFAGENFIVSIHRLDQDFISELRLSFKPNLKYKTNASGQLLTELLKKVFKSYRGPIEVAEDELEKLEMGVFGAHGSNPFNIEEGYYLKRKASVFKRILGLSIGLLEINAPRSKGKMSSALHSIHVDAQKAYFQAEQLLENSNTLLNLHLALASQRTNEVMRILTIFSVFILPLNVLTGIYGMNFEHMPELKWVFGYPLALGLMVFVLAIIYFWFKRQGWLKL